MEKKTNVLNLSFKEDGSIELDTDATELPIDVVQEIISEVSRQSIKQQRLFRLSEKAHDAQQSIHKLEHDFYKSSASRWRTLAIIITIICFVLSMIQLFK